MKENFLNCGFFVFKLGLILSVLRFSREYFGIKLSGFIPKLSVECSTIEKQRFFFQFCIQYQLNILVISRIENDTMQRIDVDELSKSIRIALMKSGKVRVTAFQEDAMVMASGQLRQSKEFNQSNVRKSGSLAAPELSLSGKITQREFIVSGKKRIEYRFSMSITDLRNGLTLWEGEEKIKKLADKNAVTW